jgi:hypothetical protein
VLTIASGNSSQTASMTSTGDNPGPALRARGGCSSRQARMRSRHGRMSGGSTSGSSCSSTVRASPTMGMATVTLREMEIGSMSMCTICAPVANLARSPVARSSKRVPTANSRSQWLTAMLAW